MTPRDRQGRDNPTSRRSTGRRTGISGAFRAPASVALAAILLFGSHGCSGDSAGQDVESDAGTSGSNGSGGSTGGSQADATGSSGGATGSSPDDLHACTGPGQCLLVEAARDCCEPRCGPVDISFYTAIHADHLMAWHAGQMCAGCPDPACSDEDKTAFTRSSVPIVAVCDAGQCKPLDLRETEVTECTTDGDCRVRYGADCCEEQFKSENSYIAISDDNALQDLTCPERYVPCGARPLPPEGATAQCRNGRCELIRHAMDGGSAEAGATDATPSSIDSGATDSGPTDGGS